MHILIIDICLRKITPRLLNVTLPFQFFGNKFSFLKTKNNTFRNSQNNQKGKKTKNSIFYYFCSAHGFLISL